MTTSTHARRRHHPAVEAGLWLVWTTVRYTGLAAFADLVVRLGRATPGLYRTTARAAHRLAHTVALRAALAVDGWLTTTLVGATPGDGDEADQRRALQLIAVAAILLNVVYVVAR